ncbi:MAG: glycine cleavage system protein GcvH [Firmicutes bacterium]|nr:glycine cleavage system protein GcvH [Bacillota bacterium]
MKYKVIEGLRYTKKHEWARQEGGVAIVGLCDYAQDKLGEIVFVELPDVGAVVEAGKSVAVVESVKAVADLYSPLSGTVTEINEVLLDQPETINQDPYGEGWVYKVEMADEAELGNLMDKAAYEEFIIKEEEE